MTNQELGSSFENITKEFFFWLFTKIGFTVTKARVQKAGNQHGFDVLIIISKDYRERKIFIECKNYESDLSIGNIYRKAVTLKENYELNEGDLFIAINPRSNFSNEDNPEKLSPGIDQMLKCSYYALDVSNGVKALFALNSAFYKELYKTDPDFPINEQEEINRFSEIIFSRKPFQKIIIRESDKIKFIGDLKADEHTIERFFIEDALSGDSRLKQEKAKPIKLSEIMEKEDKVFIIGNPGIGKSTELKKFALESWHTGETEGFVPIFKSLKHFTGTDSITDYLPTGWEELNNAFLILDGIDEIADIEYFKSKLETFIQNADSQKKFKFIISCRSNVYESIVKGVSDFKVYFLRDLHPHESLDFLQRKYGSKMDSLYYSSAYTNFLKTPFQLEILADFINNNKEIPHNTTTLWEQYITSRLNHDKNEKLKKASLNIPAIKKWSMKVSLINELMKSNIIGDEDLYTVLGEDGVQYEQFKKNPLLNVLPNQEKYFFEHRNIQEYFAAKALSRMPAERIKEFLIIDNGINRTHPSLFNTITFLLNIADDAQFSVLVDWLAANEPELLFKADSDRAERYRVQVFQGYFYDHCIVKTFWINSSRTFSAKEIADFGDCEPNIDYLLGFITSPEAHFRVKISAMELLAHFTIPPQKKDNLKSTLFALLENAQNPEMIRSHLLECIHELKFCEGDENLLDAIFALFKGETSKQINRALLSFLEQYEHIDRFFVFLKHEFLLDKGLEKRKNADDVSRGTSWVLERIILRLQQPDHFIDLAKHYFDEETEQYIDRKYVEEIVARCAYFENLDPEFLVKLFQSFLQIKDYYFREHALKDLILNSSVAGRQNLFRHFTEQVGFKAIGYFMATVTDEHTIGIVMDRFADSTLDCGDLDYYRNVLGNTRDRKLAEYFNVQMMEKGFVFTETYPSQEEIDKLISEAGKRPQEDFDMLFDPKLLLARIQPIFKRYGPVIRPAMIRQIDKDWYGENGRSARMELCYSLLSRIVYKLKTNMRFAGFKRIILEDDLLLMNEIKSQLQLQNDSNPLLDITGNHKEFIRSWCLKSADEIQFSNIATMANGNPTELLGDFLRMKTVLYFAIKFDLKLPQEFLLKSIEFIDLNRRPAQDGTFSQLLGLIKDRDEADRTIIANLHRGNLYSLSLRSHIQHALDQNLKESFPLIAAYLRNQNDNFNIDRTLKQYIALSGDTALLPLLCGRTESHKCWSSLKLMMELGVEPEFCLQKALLYLESPKDDNHYSSSALSILFELRSPEAVPHLMAQLENENLPSLQESSYSAYDLIDRYEILQELYDKIYIKNDDKFGLSDIRRFLSAYVSNLSKDKARYDLVQQELESIKTKITNSSAEKELFYINHLLDESGKGFVNAQSKAFCFKDALSKADEIFQ